MAGFLIPLLASEPPSLGVWLLLGATIFGIGWGMGLYGGLKEPRPHYTAGPRKGVAK